MYHLLCSHLRNTSSIASSVDLLSSSQPKPVRSSSSFRNITFQASRAPVAIARETEHSGRRTHEGYRGMCSDPVDRGGEVRRCYVGCRIGMWDIVPIGVYRSSWWVHRISITFFFPAGVFWVRRNFLVFGLAQNRYFVSAPLDVTLKFMPHTAHLRSLLSAARSSSNRRRLARSSTRRVF